MLEFQYWNTSNRPNNKATKFRHDEELGLLIDQAATSLGVDKSTFLRSIAAKEAIRVLTQQRIHIPTPEDAELLAAAFDAPPEPTPRAIEAAALYKQHVVHVE